MRSPAQGAATSIFCATEPGLEAQSGGNFADCAPKDPSRVVTPALGAELWERSTAWVAPWAG